MVSAYVILSEPSERRISFRQSEGANFERNETLRYAQGDKTHRRLVQSVADHYIFSKKQIEPLVLRGSTG